MDGPIPSRGHRHRAKAAKSLQEEGFLSHHQVLHQEILLHVRSPPPPSATPKILGASTIEPLFFSVFPYGFRVFTLASAFLGFPHFGVLLYTWYCDVFLLGALLDWESGNHLLHLRRRPTYETSFRPSASWIVLRLIMLLRQRLFSDRYLRLIMLLPQRLFSDRLFISPVTSSSKSCWWPRREISSPIVVGRRTRPPSNGLAPLRGAGDKVAFRGENQVQSKLQTCIPSRL